MAKRQFLSGCSPFFDLQLSWIRIYTTFQWMTKGWIQNSRWVKFWVRLFFLFRHIFCKGLNHINWEVVSAFDNSKLCQDVKSASVKYDRQAIQQSARHLLQEFDSISKKEIIQTKSVRINLFKARAIFFFINLNYSFHFNAGGGGFAQTRLYRFLPPIVGPTHHICGRNYNFQLYRIGPVVRPKILRFFEPRNLLG